MPVSIIQKSKIVATSSASPFTLSLTGVSAQSTLVLMFNDPAASRIWSVVDSLGNDWIMCHNAAGAFGMVCAIATGVTSGNVTVTVTASAAATITDAVLYELSRCTLEKFDWFTGASGTSHNCAQAAGVNIPADSLVLAHARSQNLSVTTLVPGSGYTSEVATVASAYIQQQKSFGSAVTGERAPFTSTGSARAFTGALFSFRDLTQTVQAQSGYGYII